MNPYAGHIYIDGSCYKNPGGFGGIAGILEMPENENEPEVIFQEGYKGTTNNRMEIRALIKALEYIKKSSLDFKNNGINEIEIWSDSEITIKGYYSAEKWRANKWSGIENNPIRNIDLFKKILTLKNSIRFSYKLQHIVNKSTDMTKKVDKLAKEAAKNSWLKVDDGYIEGKVSKTDVKGATEPFNAQGQQEVVRIFGHGLVSRKKDSLYKVKFEIYARKIEKYYAYTSYEIDKVLDRWHYYEVQFNNNPKNPRIENAKEVGEKSFLKG